MFINRGGLHLLAALIGDSHHAETQHISAAAAAAAAADADAHAEAITKEAALALGNIAASTPGRTCLLDSNSPLSLKYHMKTWFALPKHDHRHLLALRLRRCAR